MKRLPQILYFSGVLLTAVSGLMYANEYQAMDGFVGVDCDGLPRILIFLMPGTLLLGLGSFLVLKSAMVAARYRWHFMAATFVFWACVGGAKARDLQLHYVCE